MNQTIKPIERINGTITVPGDKSISHRAVMLGAIANGKTEIEGFLNADDCLSTIRVFRQLGVEIDQRNSSTYIVNGKGLYSLTEPDDVLDVGNSGTTMRLLSGILAGQSFHSVITGDYSIIRRPMKRIIDPLRLMGAKIDGKENGKYAPISIRGGNLAGINYKTPVASAQVKSAILFAGLYANTATTVIEPNQSRDHSEKLLEQFGANIRRSDNELTIDSNNKLEGQRIVVPGDFSSAAFFIAAALIVPNSQLLIKGVGLNPTRTGLLAIMEAMNGKVEVINSRWYGTEPVADLLVESSSLKGINVDEKLIPNVIDELPLLAVIATQAEGITKVTGAGELRVKESDRIKSIVSELRKLGVRIEELEDGFKVEGKQKIIGGIVSSQGDHRIGMAMAIAGLIAQEMMVIENADAINISYPYFFADIAKISKY